MDNASKGLITAGAVLLSILLITTGVYVLNTQRPEMLAKKTTDKIWEDVDVYCNLAQTPLRPGKLFVGDIPNDSIEKLDFADLNLKHVKQKIEKGALIIEDMGEEENGDVMAYAFDDDNNGLYEVIVVEAGGVRANANSSNFLNSAQALISINVEHLKTENVTDMSYMFAECKELQNLDLSSFNTSNVTTLKGSFKNCNNLKSIDVKSFNVEKVTDMTEMFYSCYSLNNLDLSNFRTLELIKMDCIFFNLVSLKTLDISLFDTSKVTTMRSGFNNCKNLDTLKLGENFVIRKNCDTYLLYNWDPQKIIDLLNSKHVLY